MFTLRNHSLNNTYNVFEVSLQNARTVVGLEWLYEGLKNYVGKLFLLFFTFVVGLPFVFLVGFNLRRKRKLFQKSMKKTQLFCHSEHEYLRLKIYLRKLSDLLPHLKRVADYRVKSAPWPVKFTLKEMQKWASTLVTYHSWLHSSLRSFNSEQFKNADTNFKFLSERELWEKRNEAYQYWM